MATRSIRATVAVLLLGALGAAPAARADQIEVAASLPGPRAGTSAVWTGTEAYIFGGFDDSVARDEIIRFTPSTGAVVTMGAHLPAALYSAAAVWTGSRAYVFGGRDGTSAVTDLIVEYDPATDTATTVGHLPAPRQQLSAVWSGTYAYLFGGSTDGEVYDTILKFDPGTGGVSTIAATLPTPRHGTTAAWAGDVAYVIGGFFGLDALRDVLRFDPATESLESLPVLLPEGRMWASSVWTGGSVLVLGGTGGSGYYRVVEIDPAGPALTERDVQFFNDNTSAIWDGAYAYVFGGFDPFAGFVITNKIYRYRLIRPPGPPANLRAEDGPELGSIQLRWDYPGNDGGAAVQLYTVSRDSGSGWQEIATAYDEGSGGSYTDTGLDLLGTYRYRVTATNSAGEGAPAELCTRPGPLTLLPCL